MVPEGDIGGHPDLPDMNHPGQWVTILSIGAPYPYPAFVSYDLAPGDEAPRPPKAGAPGKWATIIFRGERTWAWAPDLDYRRPEVEPPDPPEREPKGL